MPLGVWVLGFVSLFMDISSEMIHGLLPVFPSPHSALARRWSALSKASAKRRPRSPNSSPAGFSDKLGKRKALTVLGYGLGAVSKPLFALAPTASFVLAARFSDRIGKGIRGAPRDALIGDMVPAGLRGAAYGLRQALDTVGAFAGPLLAIALMARCMTISGSSSGSR